MACSAVAVLNALSRRAFDVEGDTGGCALAAIVTFLFLIDSAGTFVHTAQPRVGGDGERTEREKRRAPV
jgi:hypothetical protein